MKLFLDSVDLVEIKKYASFIDGVTTNPSLMAEANSNFKDTTSSICSAVHGDVSIEAASNNLDEMIQEGEKILSIAPNVVIKLPVTWDGLKACKFFADKGRKVNMTLCFSASQALMAAKAGASYISPFIGRLDDIGEDGMMLISEIRTIYDNYQFGTKILAASVRTPEHVIEAALCGADVATIPVKILSKLLDHELTEKGLEKFNQDWSNSGMQI